MGKRACSFNGCDRKETVASLCDGHYSQKRRRRGLSALRWHRDGPRPIAIDPTDPTVARVPLTQGHVALVDANDAALCSPFNWCAIDARRYGRRSVYAISGRGKKRSIHHLIGSAMGILGEGLEIDHIDGNGLNNRRSNLRAATPAQNAQNVGLQRHNTSGVKGVSWVTPNNKWRVRIDVNGKTMRLGDFGDIELASFVYLEAAAKYHGEFSKVARMACAA